MTEKQFELFLHDSKCNMDLVLIDLLNVDRSAKNRVIWRKVDWAYAFLVIYQWCWPYFSISFTKTALFSKFFTDSCVQDIYLRKLGPYGIIGPLGSYIISNFVNYYQTITHFSRVTSGTWRLSIMEVVYLSPLEVHRKSPLDFVVWPKMPGQAPENHRKNTVVKKQKNMYSAYPQSDGVRSEKQWECKDLYNCDDQDKCVCVRNGIKHVDWEVQGACPWQADQAQWVSCHW